MSQLPIPFEFFIPHLTMISGASSVSCERNPQDPYKILCPRSPSTEESFGTFALLGARCSSKELETVAKEVKRWHSILVLWLHFVYFYPLLECSGNRQEWIIISCGKKRKMNVGSSHPPIQHMLLFKRTCQQGPPPFPSKLLSILASIYANANSAQSTLILHVHASKACCPIPSSQSRFGQDVWPKS